MSVTTVPLRPISKGTLPKLWFGLVALALIGVFFAWQGTERVRAFHGTPEQFLAWNAGQSGVETTDSGLQYLVLDAGEGSPNPSSTDATLVNYEGRLVDGTVFDSGERQPINLGQVVPGFSEGVQLMSRGARYRLWIPPALGYGDVANPSSPIPANAVIVFDLELVDFISQLELMQQMQQMPAEGQPQQ
jgi:FKBP-type peptidyl-prolyl cis-trans isomerase